MTGETKGGCDTRTMGIIHAVLRRDLERAGIVLSEGATLTDDRLAALGGHMIWVMDFLHHHHHGEDANLYPVLRDQNPGAADLVQQMQAEHQAMLPQIDEVVAAGRDAQAGTGTAQARAARLLQAVTGLRVILEAHLAHEESEAMPVVEQTLSQRAWDVYEASNRRRMSPKDLACRGHWIVDGLPDADAQVILTTVPAPVRFVLLRLMGGPYRRLRESLWSGTLAEAVGATPLPRAL